MGTLSRWGALAKSNYINLGFREAVHKNLRELVMSYFEHYASIKQRKVLTGKPGITLQVGAMNDELRMTNDEFLDPFFNSSVVNCHSSFSALIHRLLPLRRTPPL